MLVQNVTPLRIMLERRLAINRDRIVVIADLYEVAEEYWTGIRQHQLEEPLQLLSMGNLSSQYPRSAGRAKIEEILTLDFSSGLHIYRQYRLCHQKCSQTVEVQLIRHSLHQTAVWTLRGEVPSRARHFALVAQPICWQTVHLLIFVCLHENLNSIPPFAIHSDVVCSGPTHIRFPSSLRIPVMWAGHRSEATLVVFTVVRLPTSGQEKSR